VLDSIVPCIEYVGVCRAQISAGFADIERKVEMDVKKELCANHDSVTKNIDKVSLASFFDYLVVLNMTSLQYYRVGHKKPSPILFCLKCYCMCFIRTK